MIHDFRIIQSAADIILSKIYSAALPSNPAKLQIIQHPEDQTITTGESAAFTVKANKPGSTYQWQYLNASLAWADVTSMEGNQTVTLIVPAASYRNGAKYRCKVTAPDGAVIFSHEVTLTIA